MATTAIPQPVYAVREDPPCKAADGKGEAGHPAKRLLRRARALFKARLGRAGRKRTQARAVPDTAGRGSAPASGSQASCAQTSSQSAQTAFYPSSSDGSEPRMQSSDTSGQSGESAEPGASTNSALDTGRREGKLYAVLNVSRDASDGDIRRAYYVAAREVHPDKNPGDEDATQRFQDVSYAYQVLSNVDSRDAYDQRVDEGEDQDGDEDEEEDEGEVESDDDRPPINPQTVFTEVFGTDHVLSYVGELEVTTLLYGVDVNGNLPGPETRGFLEEARIHDLIYDMTEATQSCVDGDMDSFLLWVDNEAIRLLSSSVDRKLLSTIGQAYIDSVDIVVGRQYGLPLLSVARLRSGAKSARLAVQNAVGKRQLATLTGAVLQRQNRIVEDFRARFSDWDEDVSDVEAHNEDIAWSAQDLMWVISVLDIRKHVLTAADRFLHVAAVSHEQVAAHAARTDGVPRYRHRGALPDDGRYQIVAARAEALRHMGTVLVAAAREMPPSRREREAGRRGVNG